MTAPAFPSRLGHALVGALVNTISLGSLVCLAGPVVAAWLPVLAESRGLQAAAVALSSLPGGAWCLRRHAREWRVPLATAAAWSRGPYCVLVAVAGGALGAVALGVDGAAGVTGLLVVLGAGALGPLLAAVVSGLVGEAGK